MTENVQRIATAHALFISIYSRGMRGIHHMLHEGLPPHVPLHFGLIQCLFVSLVREVKVIPETSTSRSDQGLDTHKMEQSNSRSAKLPCCWWKENTNNNRRHSGSCIRLEQDTNVALNLRVSGILSSTLTLDEPLGWLYCRQAHRKVAL
jgi:hypothetical protein